MDEIALGIEMNQEMAEQAVNANRSIDEELNDLFNQNLKARLEKPTGFIKLLSGMMSMKKQTQKLQGNIKNPFQRAKELLFESSDPDRLIADIWDDHLTLGVCAKVLRAGDVAWKCEDCEKDPTCIICLDCFNNSDHEGHKTWLKTNVGGCCDCGDPEGWDMNGACFKHKGIDSSKDVALNALPPNVRQNAPTVFRSLTRSLKTCLLGVIENQDDSNALAIYESMVSDFIDESDTLLASWKQCIFYLSEAYINVFYGEHVIKEGSKHKCCYRYFPDEEFRGFYEEQKAVFESMQSSFSDEKRYCTCTVIDLLFQADQKFSVQQKLNKRITQQCIQLFQSYNFKQHLGFGYIANMSTFLRHHGDAKGLAALGVQILTMDSVTQRIFADPVLQKMVPDTLGIFLKELIEDENSDQGLYSQCVFLSYDLKYIAKPALMPQIVENTTMIQDLIEGISQLCFKDAQKNSTSMEEFGDVTSQSLYVQASIELQMTSVIEKKFLTFVKRNQDVARMIAFFKKKFEEIENMHKEVHSDEGFFIVPIHRMFTFLITRVLMAFYVKKRMDANEESKEPPSPNFHNYIVSEKIVASSEELQQLLELALVTGARQLGFIAEIEAKKWIYKGERFKLIAQIEHEAYEEKYLRMIALFQIAICASEHKSRCVDILIQNFSTDDWISTYVMSLGHPNGPSKEMFQGLKNFSPEKLATQIQLLFVKLIEISITEASFLLPSQKKLLQSKTDEKGRARLNNMFTNHLRREMMHVLFSLGANVTINQIKKASHAAYLKTDLFTQAVIEMSTQQTDTAGKKQFRLNQKAKLEAMFDPYYIVVKKTQSAQQTAYDSFYKNNPNCNNIVGDYMGNYQYQTGINKECWQAFAQSRLLTEVVSKSVKECLKVWIETREQTKAEAFSEAQLFRQSLFPLQTMFMGLKLLIIVCQNCQSQETIKFIQGILQTELLNKAFNATACKDPKLSEIGLYLTGLIHQGQLSSSAEELKTAASTQTQAKTMQAKKDLAAKKKAAMLAKMKKKQTNFIKEPKAATQEETLQESTIMAEETDINQHRFSQSCASCQEPLDISKFYERPFAQLCYLSSTKLLYYTYYQTVQSQIQSLKNLKDANNFTTQTNNLLMPKEEEESKKPIVSSSSLKDSVSEANYDLDEEEPHKMRDKAVLYDLQLRDVIDEKQKTGVAFDKCCHAFHLDCLQQYQIAEGQLNYQRIYVKQMVGYDENCIQCPMCKTTKNTWQPLLPLGLDRDQASSSQRLTPYIDFCSQLITNHLNNPNNGSDPDERGLARQILAVDIKNDPEKFVLQMCSVVTHMVMENTCLNSQKFLLPFNPQTQQNDVLLRDIVYNMLTTREIVKRLFQETEPHRLNEIGVSLICQISTALQTENVFSKNFQKLVVRLMFICGICMGESLIQVKKALVQSLYASFKGQVILAEVFRKSFGRLERGKLVTAFNEALQQGLDFSNSSIVESQLTFLRAAASMSLSIDALMLCQAQPLASFESQEAMQLNLNQAFIDQLRQQVDDQSEFNLLLGYLELNPSLNQENVFKVPPSLETLMQSHNYLGFEYYSILNVAKLDQDILAQATDLAQTAPSADLPTEEAWIDKEMKDEDQMISMPLNLHLLTTYYTFNFVELPADFQILVKLYYTRQCRGCKKQLQESAICLLCGEIVCMANSQKCCGDRPGMKKLLKRRENVMNFFGGSDIVLPEGELSYHARYCEGGNSIFLNPQEAKIFIVDQGRILNGDSPYRNALGETFSQKSAKWDNYLLSEETGGVQVLANLKKNYMEHKLPQIILNGRQEGERVILRHVL